MTREKGSLFPVLGEKVIHVLVQSQSLSSSLDIKTHYTHHDWVRRHMKHWKKMKWTTTSSSSGQHDQWRSCWELWFQCIWKATGFLPWNTDLCGCSFCDLASQLSTWNVNASIFLHKYIIIPAPSDHWKANAISSLSKHSYEMLFFPPEACTFRAKKGINAFPLLWVCNDVWRMHPDGSPSFLFSIFFCFLNLISCSWRQAFCRCLLIVIRSFITVFMFPRGNWNHVEKMDHDDWKFCWHLFPGYGCLFSLILYKVASVYV